MKSVNISIQNPCNENWDKMPSADRGRFCASCSKNVIDFTGMNDRQLAEFFKKPKDNICGRFFQDQLERNIDIPKKKIPWVRYFFQFTWPALVFFLKSCGQKPEKMGKIIANVEQPVNKKPEAKQHPLPSLSFSPGDVKGSPTIIIHEEPGYPAKEIENAGKKTGLLGNGQENELNGEKLPLFKKDTLIDDDTIVIAKTPMENVTITSCFDYDRRVVVMGGIGTSIKVSGITDNKEHEPQKLQPAKVFPNPARAGSLVTISFDDENAVLPQVVELISSSGQVILEIATQLTGLSRVFNLNLPAGLKAGMYFIRLTGINNQSDTHKIIIQ